jgi:hypothetical protein
VERMVGLVEETGSRHGIEHPAQMTIATTDGTTIWAFRYPSEGHSRSLYSSTRMDALQALYPESEELASLGRDAGRRLGAARRPPRRLERGSGVPRGDRPAGSRRAPSVHAGVAGLTRAPAERARPRRLAGSFASRDESAHPASASATSLGGVGRASRLRRRRSPGSPRR